MSSTWLITGATSGFGRLVAERALADDAHVIAAVHAAGGHLDVLVNNAGYGLFGSVEQIDVDEARAIFDANVLANLAVLRATLPALRAARARVVQISSLIGQFAWPSSGAYAGSRGAVELIGELIAPNDVYGPTVGKFLTDFSELPPEAFGDPGTVADAVMAVTALEEPPLRLAVGADAVEHIRASLRSRLAELDRWESFAPAAGWGVCPHAQRRGDQRQKTRARRTLSLPSSTYSAPGGLRQDPGGGAESSTDATTCGNEGSTCVCCCRRMGNAVTSNQGWDRHR